MRRRLLVPLLAAAVACAGDRAAAPGRGGTDRHGSVLRAAELARVRCLVVTPFENGSDAPLASDAATSALVSDMDTARVQVFPVPELRALFRDTSLELPAGIGPPLALELGELLGADAVLYGSVDGGAQGAAPELLVTMRLSLVGEHRLLFATTALVTPAAGERTESAIRRAVLAAARPALTRLGDPVSKRCFDSERSSSLRSLALAQAVDLRLAQAPPPAPAAAPVAPPAASPEQPVPARAPLAPAPAGIAPRTPRQAEWARRLESGDRFVVEEIGFAPRTADLQHDGGLADLAAALLAQPSVAVLLEGFVDATSDPVADRKLSVAMAEVAARELAQRGVPRQRIAAVGRGGESPRLPNFTARGRAANRRIEVVAFR